MGEYRRNRLDSLTSLSFSIKLPSGIKREYIFSTFLMILSQFQEKKCQKMVKLCFFYPSNMEIH